VGGFAGAGGGAGLGGRREMLAIRRRFLFAFFLIKRAWAAWNNNGRHALALNYWGGGNARCCRFER
jgi:hypothetical protein